jgi:Tfp pilus assembly protein PilF
MTRRKKSSPHLTRSSENPSRSPAPTRHPFRTILIGAIIVAAASFLAQGPSLRSQAQFLDDGEYLTRNSLVQHPSWESVRTILTEVRHPSTVTGYYQPLAMISLMLDFARCRTIDSLNGYHQTSLILHTVNALLLMILLIRLVNWPVAAVGAAALFAAHPLMTESVVWISERKTLLATGFSLLALISYVSFARRKGAWRYLAMLGFYALAILSKPTAVPVPLFMVLMDIWPLRRVSLRTLLEKVPVFALAGLAGWITVISQQSTGGAGMPTHQSLSALPLVVGHALLFYVWKFFWPTHLSPYYPPPEAFSWAQPALLVGLVAAVAWLIACVLFWRKTRVPLVGSLILIIGLLPTMGLVTFTSVITANRFFYLPSIGGWLMLAAAMSTWRRWHVAIVCAAFLSGEVYFAHQYLKSWESTPSLITLLLDESPQSAIAHSVKGEFLLTVMAKPVEAEAEFRTALSYQPNFPNAVNNLGLALMEQHREREAKPYLERALQLSSKRSAETLSNLSVILAGEGNIVGAIAMCEEALQISPNYPPAHCAMGMILAAAGRFEAAVARYEKALELDPRLAVAHDSLGVSLGALGRYELAVHQFKEALRLQPTMESAQRHLRMAGITPSTQPVRLSSPLGTP